MAGRPLSRAAAAADGAISISICDYDERVERAYPTLFPGELDKTPELLRWRFKANPHGPAKFAVANHGGEIVGLIALVPTQLRNTTGKGIAYQAIDTVVHPSCRGQGLFVRMGEAAQDSGALGGDILWGFPNANAAAGWYGRLGWTNFGAVPLLMRPLRSSFLLGRVHRKLRLIDVPLVRKRSASAKVYKDAAEFSRDLDQLWNGVAPVLGTAVNRTGEWMRWRLFDKPGANYRCAGLKSGTGGLEAFVATKVEHKHGARLCYVMEAVSVPERTADLTRLLLEEVALAARSGAEAALAWCPKTTPNHTAYRKAGFLPVPPRLRPIEINFGARALVPECASAAAPDAKWYVSFLDSDTN